MRLLLSWGLQLTVELITLSLLDGTQSGCKNDYLIQIPNSLRAAAGKWNAELVVHATLCSSSRKKWENFPQHCTKKCQISSAYVQSQLIVQVFFPIISCSRRDVLSGGGVVNLARALEKELSAAAKEKRADEKWKQLLINTRKTLIFCLVWVRYMLVFCLCWCDRVGIRLQWNF